jgi:hypothetical protein
VVPDRNVVARQQRREQGDSRRGGDRWGSAVPNSHAGGLDVATLAAGLSAASVMITAVMCAMPLFTIHAILGGGVAEGRSCGRRGSGSAFSRQPMARSYQSTSQ